MPFYEYECKKCEVIFDKRLSFSQCDSKQTCTQCGSPDNDRVISQCGFVLRGDGFPGKNIKIKRQKENNNHRLKRKQDEFKRSGRVPSLVPNVDGEETDNWTEAKKLAASKGKSTTGYEQRIRKEKSK